MNSRLWRLSAVAAVMGAMLLPESVLGQGRMRPAIGPGSYFPLRPGNAWTYQRLGPGGITDWSAKVIDQAGMMRAMPYFVLSGYFLGEPHTVRSDPFSTVTERAAGARDTLWYLLGAPDGTSWTIQLAPSPLASPQAGCISGAKLTLTERGATVRVPAGEFNHVIRVDWVSPCVDAGIASEWFAPGVGLIRREEITIAGTVTSELLHAELGDVMLPRASYSTSLALDRATYVNDLMPVVGPAATPTAAGSFTVASRPDSAITLTFEGCKSVSVTVSNAAGEIVRSAQADDGGCCTCDSRVEWDFSRGPLVIPFSVSLATEKGEPLPDGRYVVAVTLETNDGAALQPAARAVIAVTSTH